MPRFILERSYSHDGHDIFDTRRGRAKPIGRIEDEYVDMFERLFARPLLHVASDGTVTHVVD